MKLSVNPDFGKSQSYIILFNPMTKKVEKSIIRVLCPQFGLDRIDMLHVIFWSRPIIQNYWREVIYKIYFIVKLSYYPLWCILGDAVEVGKSRCRRLVIKKL